MLRLLVDASLRRLLLFTANLLSALKCLRVPQRGQHSPSGTVALAQGIRGQDILRHTVAEFCKNTKIQSIVYYYK